MKQIRFALLAAAAAFIFVGCATDSRIRTAHSMDEPAMTQENVGWTLSPTGEPRP